MNEDLRVQILPSPSEPGFRFGGEIRVLNDRPFNGCRDLHYQTVCIETLEETVNQALLVAYEAGEVRGRERMALELRDLLGVK